VYLWYAQSHWHIEDSLSLKQTLPVYKAMTISSMSFDCNFHTQYANVKVPAFEQPNRKVFPFVTNIRLHIIAMSVHCEAYISHSDRRGG
jgi:hypothetical protein